MAEERAGGGPPALATSPQWSVSEMPLVVSVTVTSAKATVIDLVQSGWKDAVTESVKSALPFWTGKSPDVETLVLFAA